MIRDSVRKLVDLCQFVTQGDEGHSIQNSIQNSTVPVDSYRKTRWKQRREASRLGERKQANVTQTQTQPCGESALSAPTDETTADDPQQGTNRSDDDSDAHSVPSWDQFLDDFVASDLEVSDITTLRSRQFDPLGATSVPSRREGHSLTMCCFESTRVLVVFGGRQLRDLTNLLPVSSTEIDPLKLERVRYVFSNGLYSYDIQTTLWELHQCTGTQPSERSDHSAVFVAPHFLVVFGGRGRSGLILNDLFVLSLVDWHWTEINTRSSPSHRYWHGCCTGTQDLFVFGGKSEIRVHGDLQQFSISQAIQQLLHKQEEQKSHPDQSPRPFRLLVPQSWMNPHTVGKPPSARFGLRMIRIDHDRFAFVGGWRPMEISASEPNWRSRRCLDVYVLDTLTMVWTKPRFSSHICRLSAPPERFLFECFYTQRSLVVFGGFTYASNGETESYQALEADSHIIYKLDLHRMVWRRHVATEPTEVAVLRTASPFFSSNAVLRDAGGPRKGFSCVVSSEQLPIELTAMTLQKTRLPRPQE